MHQTEEVSWNNPIIRGFVATAAYYILGLGTSYVLAQRMPIADTCNPGTPLLVGVGILVLGLGAALLTIGILFSHRYRFQAMGSLFAHVLCISLFAGFVALSVMYNG